MVDDIIYEFNENLYANLYIKLFGSNIYECLHFYLNICIQVDMYLAIIGFYFRLLNKFP
jgi:hypothetical protein